MDLFHSQPKGTPFLRNIRMRISLLGGGKPRGFFIFSFDDSIRSSFFLLHQPPYFLLTNLQNTLKIIHLPLNTAGG